jgi:DNA repair exonuclease SbcCD ATPase subunit
MSIDTVFSAFVLGFTPLASEHWGLLAFLVILSGGGVWFFLDKKLKALAQHSKEQAAFAAAALESQTKAADAAAAVAQQKLDEAAVAHRLLEERLNTLREVSQRREEEAEQRITSLSADLAATRELAAQLEPTKSALAAERGRISALEQTIEVSNKRAEDFERRLDQSHRELTEQRQNAEQRLGELQTEVEKLCQTIKTNEALVATADSQISEATETLNAYRQQAETRIANLQRQLTAAEAKSAMVQKEFMSAVGVLPDKPAPAKSSAPASGDDKRLAELEAKITQLEADARKKAREDGYKIAELEFRLSEAQEALAQKGPPPQE